MSISDYCKYQEIFINGSRYLFVVSKKNDSFSILFTNFVDFWEETHNKESISKRFKELNPALRLNDNEIIEKVNNMLTDIMKYLKTATNEKIHLEIVQDVLKIGFDIVPQKSTADNFYKIQAEVLCLSFFELHHRYQILLNLVKKKDKEILEYKAQGAKLAIESRETKKFSEELFQLQPKAYSDTFDLISSFMNISEFYENIRKVPTANETQVKFENETEDLSAKQTNTLKVNKTKPKNRSSDLRCAIRPNESKRPKGSATKKNFNPF